MGVFIPIFAGFFILMIVLAVLGSIQAKKRREAMALWCRRHGLSFSEGRERGFRDAYPDFRCLHAGDQDRYAFNICTGRWNGRPMIAFDYHYETESTDSKGKRSTTSHYFSAITLEAELSIEPLVIRPEGLWDKLTQFFGYDDIDFESAEFSRRFHVSSPDRRWAYDVLHPRAMEFLLDAPQRTIQFGHGCVLVHGGGRYDPIEFEQSIAIAAGLLDKMPDYLRQAQTVTTRR